MKVDQTVEYVLKFLTTSWGRVPLLGLPLYIWSETAVPLCSPLPAGVQSMTPVGSGTHTLRHLGTSRQGMAFSIYTPPTSQHLGTVGGQKARVYP